MSELSKDQDKYNGSAQEEADISKYSTDPRIHDKFNEIMAEIYEDIDSEEQKKIDFIRAECAALFKWMGEKRGNTLKPYFRKAHE
jgi:hypothetical protein